MRGPYDARTGVARGTRGVLRIIRPNHKCTAVSSRTGPVVWCDHENSTDVKFLRALHSALRARNRTDDKNRTGPVVGSDWGIILKQVCKCVIRPVAGVILPAVTLRALWVVSKMKSTCRSEIDKNNLTNWARGQTVRMWPEVNNLHFLYRWYPGNN